MKIPGNHGKREQDNNPGGVPTWLVRAEDSGDVILLIGDRLVRWEERREAESEAADALVDWMVHERRSKAPIYLRWHLGDLADDRGLFLARYCDFVYRDGRWRLEQTVWDADDPGEASSQPDGQRRPLFDEVALETGFWMAVADLRALCCSEEKGDHYEDLFADYERRMGSVRFGNLLYEECEWLRLRDEIRLSRDEVLGFFLGSGLTERVPEFAGTQHGESILREILELDNPALRESLRRQLQEAGRDAVLERFPGLKERLPED